MPKAIFDKTRYILASKNVKLLIIIFVVTRLLLLSVGIASRDTYPNIRRMFDTDNERVDYGSLGTVLHGWDSNWYLKIAKEGYTRIDLTGGILTTYVFFPVYPFTIKILGLVTGDVLAGVIISNICFLLSGIMLYFLVALRKNKNLALLSAVYLFVFPMNYVFSAIQSESIFLLLLLLSFYFLEKKKFLYAGVAGFFLSLTKYVGFTIFLPVAYFCFKYLWGRGNAGKLKTVFYTILPITGVLLFALFLYKLTGNPFAIVNAEKGWQKSFDLNIFKPFSLLGDSIQNFSLVRLNFGLGLLIAFMALMGATGFGLPYMLIVIVYFLVYLSTTSLFWHTFSLPRYFIVLFPAYAYLASLSKSKSFFKYSFPIVLMILQMIAFSYWTRGWPIPM